MNAPHTPRNTPQRSLFPLNARTIWPETSQDQDHGHVCIIDQTALPHALHTVRLATLEDTAQAIRSMQVRGAPLIGVTAAYGMALAMQQDASDDELTRAIATLAATRPTAVNLAWALARMRHLLQPLPAGQRTEAAWREAAAIAEADVEQCRRIGEHGLALLRPRIVPGQRLNLMTHCNAGALATVAYGTALSPIYAAHAEGIDVHVWVSETRPRNQGLLTAWELRQRGVPHTVIADNAAGLLLAQGRVDAVIVGADRIAANGDVANKVGTYLKALAARAANVPFHVAAPASTIDFACPDGAAIPIEARDGDEVRRINGLDARGEITAARILPVDAAIANPAFDITPAACVTALITERGACPATADGLRGLYPERM